MNAGVLLQSKRHALRHRMTPYGHLARVSCVSGAEGHGMGGAGSPGWASSRTTRSGVSRSKVMPGNYGGAFRARRR